jgi:hypothetical protein
VRHKNEDKHNKKSYLAEVLTTLNEGMQCWWVLPLAVPRAGCIANPVFGVCNPLLGLLRHVLDFKDAALPVLGGEDVRKAAWRNGDIVLVAKIRHLVKDRLLHHGGRVARTVESELRACGVPRANVGVNGVADARHVWGLGQVIAPATRPHEHVVREVARDAMCALLVTAQAAAQRSNVFVVPEWY